MKTTIQFILSLCFAMSFLTDRVRADDNPFQSFVGSYRVISGDCMKDMAKVACPAVGISIVIIDNTAYLKEHFNSGGQSHELFVRSQKDFSHWDVAELGGTPPDFAFWRRQLSEQNGHVQTVMRQFTRRQRQFEYSFTLYEKESLNGKRVNLNYKYGLEAI